MADPTGVQTNTLSGTGFERLPGKIISKTIASTAVDTGNTGKTHVLRRGLCLGNITASSKLAEYDDTNSDGTEVGFGILASEVDLKHGDTTADSVDTVGSIYVDGWVKSAYLIGYDAAFAVDVAHRIYVD